MKNIFIIFIAVFSVMTYKGQTNIINITETADADIWDDRDGSTYLKDIDNISDKYVGTWKWTSGIKEFTLTLIKQTKFHDNFFGDNYYEDRIVGYYVYKENGQIIANTSNDDLNYVFPKVRFTAERDNLKIYMSGFIEDYVKRRRYYATIEPSILILSQGLTKIKLTMRDDEYICIKHVNDDGNVVSQFGCPLPEPGNTFPMEMILIKQP